MKINKVFMMKLLCVVAQFINAQQFVIDNFSKEPIFVQPLWKGCKEGPVVLQPNERSKKYDSSVNPVEGITWTVGDRVQYTAVIKGGMQKLLNGNFVVLERGKFQQNLRAKPVGSKLVDEAQGNIDNQQVAHVTNRTSGLIKVAPGGRNPSFELVSAIAPDRAVTYSAYSRDLSGLHWNQSNTHYFIPRSVSGQDIEIVGVGIYKYGSDGKQYRAEIIP